MSQHTAVESPAQEKLIKPGAPINGGALAAAAQAAEAIEPSLWQRYSPHHEFPLSVLTTFVMYFFAVLVVLVLGGLALNLWSSPNEMVLEPIVFSAGGGGDPDAKRITNVNNEPQEALDLGLPDDPTEQTLLAPKADLTAPDVTDRLQNQARGKPFVGEKSKGQGGPGSGGGRGKGRGPGEGDEEGPGKQSMREQRKDRWVVNFPFNTPEDYLRRLSDLGAYLAFPEADKKFRLYEDLGRRTPSGRLGTIDDLRKWNRIYWRDTNPNSCDAIASALDMSTRPPHFWIFLPVELEKELFAKEKAYRNLSEDELIRQNLETDFSVERIGNGFSVKVLRQERKRTSK